ncbi:class I SAM-dependent methyltransferase [Anaeromyxobacter terrae]|uniref:class I SAM-dependent methyltransferase n=1 Tax=Anaeromyxobacter terrae TaxID=2925406 RepID=UPI001F55DB2E|nr:class I SAM-dependent methyltransferase [Anaeromyxobacter sp. SG22]
MSPRPGALKRLLPPAGAQVARGLQTCLPGARRSWGATGGTDGAPYCYEVFLKHLTLSVQAGMAGVPASVAEIGPGDSIGIGLAALLAGADRYAGLDVVPYSLAAHNRRILDELAGYFSERRPNPPWGWPRYDHLLDARSFPSRILRDESLARSLAPARLDRIRAALEGGASEPIRIEYHCPWASAAAIEPETVDWLYSHSVMEHVDGIEAAYSAMSRWLRPGGFVSHQIDLRSHELFPEWNGHWGVSRLTWRLIRGRRAYLINRLPYSAHARAIRRFFEVRLELLLEEEGGLPAGRLRAPFDRLDDRERRTSGYFVVAVKR